MKKESILLVVCFVMILSSTFAKSAFGGAMDSSSIGVKSWMTASAVTGIADDSSAVHWNPAGLVFHEDQEKDWHAQTYAIVFFNAKMKFESKYGIRDSSETDTILPGFFISKKYDKWAFGFGNYLPYASGGSTFKDFQGTAFDVKGGSGYLAITSAAAYKISPDLSVGVGFSSYYAVMDAEYMMGGKVELDYKGLSGYGVHASVLYKLNKEVSLGFCVRSPIDIKMEGDVTRQQDYYSLPAGKYDSEIEFTLPFYFTLGVGYKPNSKITLGLDICYMLYEDTDEKTIKTDDGTPTIDNETHYTNMWRIGLGMDYKINSRFNYMAGIKYNEHSTKAQGLDTGTDVDATSPVLIPSANDVDLYSFYSGVLYDYSEKVELGIGVCHTMGIERTYNSQKYDQDHWYLLFASRFRW